jgi:DMSO/TMAO reductase YedYZ heme-binding membrane subunit
MKKIKVILGLLGICFLLYHGFSEEKSTIGVIIYTFIFLILIALSFKSTQKKHD